MSRNKNMVTLANQYVDNRRKLGFKLRVEAPLTLAFAEYADREGHEGVITTELALRWSRLPVNAAPLYHARRLEIVRCFAKYAAIFDEETEIPPEGLLGTAHRRTQPHIYTDEEVNAVMNAAEELSPVGGLRPRTYVALFGILASTGLRISEALKLRRANVDLADGLLTIVKTKFHKSRFVPLHPSSTERLRAYERFRDRYCPVPTSDAFLLSEGGGDLKYPTVVHAFKTIRNGLGWKAVPGRRRPRLHDFRHTFACRRLLQWYRDGVDIEHAMTALSAYLGHDNVTSTYWYLTGIPELLEIAGEKFAKFAARMKENSQ